MDERPSDAKEQGTRFGWTEPPGPGRYDWVAPALIVAIMVSGWVMAGILMALR